MHRDVWPFPPGQFAVITTAKRRGSQVAKKSKPSNARKTSLKRTTRGYVRNLGRKPDGSQPKFYLGHEREQVIRERRLVALWEHIQKWESPAKRFWTTAYLEAAKAIAKGEQAEIPTRQYEFDGNYVARINELKEENWRRRGFAE